MSNFFTAPNKNALIDLRQILFSSDVLNPTNRYKEDIYQAYSCSSPPLSKFTLPLLCLRSASASLDQRSRSIPWGPPDRWRCGHLICWQTYLTIVYVNQPIKLLVVSISTHCRNSDWPTRGYAQAVMGWHWDMFIYLDRRVMNKHLR